MKAKYKADPSIVERQRKGRIKAFKRNNSANKISKSLGGKPIEVYRDGKLICVYETQKEVHRKLGINTGNLQHVLKGRRSTTGGYHFKYKKTKN